MSQTNPNTFLLKADFCTPPDYVKDCFVNIAALYDEAGPAQKDDIKKIINDIIDNSALTTTEKLARIKQKAQQINSTYISRAKRLYLEKGEAASENIPTIGSLLDKFGLIPTQAKKDLETAQSAKRVLELLRNPSLALAKQTNTSYPQSSAIQCVENAVQLIIADTDKSARQVTIIDDNGHIPYNTNILKNSIDGYLASPNTSNKAKVLKMARAFAIQTLYQSAKNIQSIAPDIAENIKNTALSEAAQSNISNTDIKDFAHLLKSISNIDPEFQKSLKQSADQILNLTSANNLTEPKQLQMSQPPQMSVGRINITSTNRHSYRLGSQNKIENINITTSFMKKDRGK